MYCFRGANLIYLQTCLLLFIINPPTRSFFMYDDALRGPFHIRNSTTAPQPLWKNRRQLFFHTDEDISFPAIQFSWRRSGLTCSSFLFA